MKKYLNFSLIYAVAALAGGVFYREFTKFNGFVGATALGKVHVHLFVLGMIWFLLVALFADRCPIEKQKGFRLALPLYHVGVTLSAVMLLTRGIPQVLGTALSAGMDAAISGLAGLGHVCVGVGLVLFLLAFRKAAQQKAEP